MVSNSNAQAKRQMLIFRLGSIGDTVVALPCFHAIARRFPEHHKVLLTNSTLERRASSAETVLTGTGLIDEVLYFIPGTGLRGLASVLRSIRARRFELMIYLADRPKSITVWRDLALFKLAGIPLIIGAHADGAWRSPRVDAATDELEYEPERLARLLEPEVPVDLSHEHWDLRLSAAEHLAVESRLSQLESSRPIVALAPGAKIARKDWGEDNWSAFVRLLEERHSDVSLVMIGAADERTLAEQVASTWSGDVVNTCGEMTPRETAALLGRCDLLVCHDSGPMHLAVSQATRCVAIFGDYNRPRRWFPYGADHTVVHEPRGVRSITAQRVFAAVDDALRQMELARPTYRRSA